MEAVLASAADKRYGYHLLNLLGSVERNSNLFDRVVVYDLGLSDAQRRLVHGLRSVEVRRIRPFAPHWQECFSWKPWIWTHTDADRLLYLDAGVTVLRSLDDVISAIADEGYFVVGQGVSLAEIVPVDYYSLYGLPREAGAREHVAAGIIGFRTEGEFFDRVIRPTYDDVLLGRNLGSSPGELGHRNRGSSRLDSSIIRDCPRFRHDQTLLNINLARAFPAARVRDLHT